MSSLGLKGFEGPDSCDDTIPYLGHEAEKQPRRRKEETNDLRKEF